MYLYCIVITFMPLIIKILKLTLCFWPILALFWSSLQLILSPRCDHVHIVHPLDSTFAIQTCSCFSFIEYVPWQKYGLQLMKLRLSLEPLSFVISHIMVFCSFMQFHYHGFGSQFHWKFVCILSLIVCDCQIIMIRKKQPTCESFSLCKKIVKNAFTVFIFLTWNLGKGSLSNLKRVWFYILKGSALQTGMIDAIVIISPSLFLPSLCLSFNLRSLNHQFCMY